MIFKAITSLFSSKNSNDIFDKDDGILTKTGAWINDLQFTEQERATYHKDTIESWGMFIEKTLSENTQRSITRRSIAILWIKNYLALVWVTVLAVPADFLLLKLGHTDGAFLFDALFTITFSGLMFTATLGVLGFFFGPYMLGQHLGIGQSKKDDTHGSN